MLLQPMNLGSYLASINHIYTTLNETRVDLNQRKERGSPAVFALKHGSISRLPWHLPIPGLGRVTSPYFCIMLALSRTISYPSGQLMSIYAHLAYEVDLHTSSLCAKRKVESSVRETIVPKPCNQVWATFSRNFTIIERLTCTEQICNSQRHGHEKLSGQKL